MEKEDARYQTLAHLHERLFSLGAFDALLAEIDRQMAGLLDSQGGLKVDACRLESLPGIGRQTSTQLAVLFNRVDLANSDALVAFAGLDSRACDSGQKTRRRRLSKHG